MPADADERLKVFGEALRKIADGTYEMGPAASATGHTATTFGLAAAGDSCTEPADIASLAEKVKSLQRDYPDVRDRWTQHCGRHSNGVKDPYMHNAASL